MNSAESTLRQQEVLQNRVNSLERVVQQPVSEKKPKNTEFPLDHILPVFNLNKKETKQAKQHSFIPTLKMKQKDTSQVHPFLKEKKPSIVKGSMIQHTHLMND